jgi:hypothetical protein
MIKVSAPRTEELIAAGDADRMVMRGRPMREWVIVPTTRAQLWAELMEEAYAFVDAITPGASPATTGQGPQDRDHRTGTTGQGPRIATPG